MEMKKILFWQDLDKFLAIIGIVFSVCLIIYLSLRTNSLIYIITGFLILISCSIWLFIRKKVSINKIDLQSPSAYLILNIIFFSLLACSFFSIYFTEQWNQGMISKATKLNPLQKRFLPDCNNTNMSICLRCLGIISPAVLK